MADRYGEWLVKNTGSQKGRHSYVNPANSELKLLSYGRVVLEESSQEIQVNSGEDEIAFICLKGNAHFRANQRKYMVGKHDAIYIPRNTSCLIGAENKADLVECSAPSGKESRVTLVNYEKIKDDSELHMSAGEVPYSREIYTLIGPQVQASRLLIGFTRGKMGNWTSWPPHEHASSREEIYLFYDMPEPAFGVQFVYTNPRKMEFVEVVRENDAVIIPKGYHPNVAAPGRGVNFVWMMAGIRPEVDRKWAAVNVQPEFKHISF
ncbi:MAG: 5-deoxy-glucuronate isomerase [bacterium]